MPFEISGAGFVSAYSFPKRLPENSDFDSLLGCFAYYRAKVAILKDFAVKSRCALFSAVFLLE